MISSQDDLMIFKDPKDGRFSVKILFKTLDQVDEVAFPY